MASALSVANDCSSGFPINPPAPLVLAGRIPHNHQCRAGASGRRIEDEIEDIARDIGLDYVTRSRFAGRNGRTAPADLIVGDPSSADIVVAAVTHAGEDG